jgi:hypothetical protein
MKKIIEFAKDDDLKLMKQILSFKALKDLSINLIEINFSGGGDDGDIDDINFYSDGKLIRFNEENNNLHKFIEEFSWLIVEKTADSVGDWFNNQGGYGTIEINVFQQTYNVNYHQYITEDFNWTDESLFH